MMKRFITIACLIGAFLSAKSQTVEYTTKNYTDKLSPLKISFTMLALDNIKPQGGILVQGAIGRLGYTAIYRQDFVKGLFMPKDNVVNIENTSSGKYFEGSVDFFFSNRLLKDRGKVRVEISSTYNSTKYFNAKCDKRKLIGLHGGFLSFSQTVSVSNSTTDDPGTYAFKTISGTPPPSTSVYYMNSNTTALVAGFVFKKVLKATVNSDGWNYFRHMGRRIYMDALIGGTSFENIVVGNNTYSAQSKVKNPIGYRIGFEWDQMGVVTCFELGMRPQRYTLAIPGYNYWNLSFSFNLFQGDKRYAMSKKYQKK